MRRGTRASSPPSSARGTGLTHDRPFGRCRFGSIRSCWTFGQPAAQRPSAGDAVMLHARIETPSARACPLTASYGTTMPSSSFSPSRATYTLPSSPTRSWTVADRLHLHRRRRRRDRAARAVSGRGEPDLPALDGDVRRVGARSCRSDASPRRRRRSGRALRPAAAAAVSSREDQRRAERGRRERDGSGHRGGERALATSGGRASSPSAARTSSTSAPHVGWRSSGSFAIARARTSSSAAGKRGRRSLARGGGSSRWA